MSKMISITEDGMFMASDNISAQDFLNITLAAQLNLFNNLVAQGADKAALYDLANEGASAFLAVFAPEIELRPDLTAEAILQKENEILTERASLVEDIQEGTPTVGMQDNVVDLASRIHKEMQLDGLIPLDSLDENGRPVKPVHK
jgi:hypothetical protein